MTLPLSLAERCRRIQLLVLDVDGVLTDGSIVYAVRNQPMSQVGEPQTIGHGEVKAFHVRDGSGLKIWHQTGKLSAILTGRSSPLVEVRAAELGITTVWQGAADKGSAWQTLLASQSLGPEQIAYLGDDLPDVPVLAQCGLACTVADGCPEALAAAHYVTQARGGRGAVREVIERILRCQGLWPKG